jgi:hypothetical protein
MSRPSPPVNRSRWLASLPSIRSPELDPSTASTPEKTLWRSPVMTSSLDSPSSETVAPDGALAYVT